MAIASASEFESGVPWSVGYSRMLLDMAARSSPHDPTVAQAYRRKDTKAFVAALLCRDTGSHPLDSGGAYGRRYDGNRQRDFRAEPSVTVRFEKWSGEWHAMVSRTLFALLTENGSVTDAAREQQRRFRAFAAKEMGERDSWFECVREYIGSAHEGDGDLSEPIHANTYNGDNALDQDMEYHVYFAADTEFVAVMAHNGADIRGGYTEPWVLELTGDEGWRSLVLNITDLWADCRKCDGHWFSTNGGYSFDADESDEKFKQAKVDPKREVVRCPCGGKIEFS